MNPNSSLVIEVEVVAAGEVAAVNGVVATDGAADTNGVAAIDGAAPVDEVTTADEVAAMVGVWEQRCWMRECTNTKSHLYRWRWYQGEGSCHGHISEQPRTCGQQ